jgi:hypothetical protein
MSATQQTALIDTVMRIEMLPDSRALTDLLRA